MKIEILRRQDIIPYENNPRKNDSSVEKVAASIKNFGFKVPIIVDKNNIIVTGHTRLKAAELLDIQDIPVIRANDLNEEQIKAFRLADNKVAEFSGWDFGKLEEEINLIEDFDMSEFGFEDIDFDFFFKEEDEPEKEKPKKEEAFKILLKIQDKNLYKEVIDFLNNKEIEYNEL